MSKPLNIEDLRAQGARVVPFREAEALARKTKQVVYSDAGEGFVTEWCWCPTRKRVVSTLYNRRGDAIV